MSEIIFVRHGQASFGEEDYDKLSQNGHRQAYLLGLKFKDLDFEFDKIICGGMVRHRETLEELQKNINLSNVIIDQRLNELNYQQLEQSYCKLFRASAPSNSEEYHTFFPKLITAWAENKLPNLDESYQTFCNRINGCIDQHMIKAKKILMVSSGGPTSILANRALSLSHFGTAEILNFTMNSSYSIFKKINNRLTLLQYNCTPHLDNLENQDLKTFI